MPRITLPVTCPVLLAFLLVAASAHAGPPSVRQRIRMDVNWRFQRAQRDAAHTGDIPVTHWRWKADASENVPAPDDERNEPWKDARIGEDVFHGRVGFAWYRTTLDNTISGDDAARLFLHFESVDDNATVYLNGTKLAHHEGWSDPFDVPLNFAWHSPGPNVLTVRVENTDGAGGITGPVSLQIHATTDDTPPEAQPDFNDHAWRTIHLPHDFVVEGTFDPSADESHGFLPTGVGWYRTNFNLTEEDRGKRLWIDFDGVYRDSSVWLNGRLLGRHPSGYTGFRYDITNYANYGGENVLAVRADARRFEGWWYEGGGIYRHVWLNKAAPLHVRPWGVFVTSTLPTENRAEITIQTYLDNFSKLPGNTTLISHVQTPNGNTVATATSVVPSTANIEVSQKVSVANPKLWSLETPNRYRVLTDVVQNGKIVDQQVTWFGIRTIRFDAEKGFFLNGKPVKIQGTCNHQDFAGVGTAMPDSLLEWRIKKLKAMGANAYRCSHNPPASELLDACDRLGMLVMDETRHLGDTSSPKSSPTTPYSDLSELKDMLLRDRNHPSIIMWSLCNEEGIQGSTAGATIFKAMKEVTNALDPTRPVTCAMNGGWGSGISLVEDLQGCNYNPGGYDDYHHRHPAQPMYGSETASTVSDRGIYANDRARAYVSAYDVNNPPWGQTAEQAWRPLAERPFMAGGYVWTGFDYRGEPTPYSWPNINSHFGIMDMCGFPKDNYYYYQAWWGNKPIVHLLPHWNWSGNEGQEISVWCHSNCEKVELFLNHTSLGVKEMPRYGHLEWKVKYAPGTLEARGYTGGRLTASDRVETTSAPVRLRLRPDRRTLLANGEEVVMVEVAVVDARGRVVPTADNEVTFDVSGMGDVAGVGNGDASSHEPDKASQRHAFNGLCMVVIKAADVPGEIGLTATSPGLQSARVNLHSRSK